MAGSFYNGGLYVSLFSQNFLNRSGSEQWYVDALQHETASFIKNFGHIKTMQSLLLDRVSDGVQVQQLLDTFDILKTICIDDAEITLAITTVLSDQDLIFWQQKGANRLNIMIHGYVQVLWINFINRAAHYIKNIAVDMVLGDPVMTPVQWREHCAQIITLPITHISIYFYDSQNGNDKYAWTDDEVADTYVWTVEFLRAACFEQYSTYDFARKGYQSRQQLVYLEYRAYKGFGPGACSFDLASRYHNITDVALYTECLLFGGPDNPVWYEWEELSVEQQRMEYCMMRLAGVGLFYQEIARERSVAWIAHFEQALQAMRGAGLLDMRDEFISIKPRGRLVENEIIAKFLCV